MKSRRRIVFCGACAAVFGLATVGVKSFGQEAKSEAKGPLPVAAAGDQVVVKREASRVIDPHKYRISLALEPKSTVTLTAPFDGIVKQAQGKLNGKLQTQAEIVRLDTTVPKLIVARADAAYKVALNEQKLAADKDETQKALAQAKLDVAKAESDLAKNSLELCSIRAPFAGELQRLLVTEGQFVKAGDPVAIVVDVSSFKVEIPVERATAEQGKGVSLKIETAEADGKIDAVLPLHPRFDALRELFDSVASAIVVIENASGQYKAGQTVYVPLIPRQPVMEVPTSSVGNLTDGQRKVQVVRQFSVRDVPVVLMGSVGTKRMFVSGPFAEGDEVIYEASHQLGDAFQLKPAAPGATAAAAGQGNETGAGSSEPGAKKTTAVGF
jgi:multidrug efflux pump subunit AcrA (membrane-fusion protein)